MEVNVFASFYALDPEVKPGSTVHKIERLNRFSSLSTYLNPVYL